MGIDIVFKGLVAGALAATLATTAEAQQARRMPRQPRYVPVLVQNNCGRQDTIQLQRGRLTTIERNLADPIWSLTPRFRDNTTGSLIEPTRFTVRNAQARTSIQVQDGRIYGTDIRQTPVATLTLVRGREPYPRQVQFTPVQQSCGQNTYAQPTFVLTQRDSVILRETRTIYTTISDSLQRGITGRLNMQDTAIVSLRRRVGQAEQGIRDRAAENNIFRGNIANINRALEEIRRQPQQATRTQPNITGQDNSYITLSAGTELERTGKSLYAAAEAQAATRNWRLGIAGLYNGLDDFWRANARISRRLRGPVFLRVFGGSEYEPSSRFHGGAGLEAEMGAITLAGSWTFTGTTQSLLSRQNMHGTSFEATYRNGNFNVFAGVNPRFGGRESDGSTYTEVAADAGLRFYVLRPLGFEVRATRQPYSDKWDASIAGTLRL